MSLNNVLAVGAVSQGNLLVLSIGLLVSMAILLVGSALVATLMTRLPWLLDIAALVMAWTGANMLLNDQQLGDILNNYSWTAIVVPVVSIGIVLVADIFLRLGGHKLAQQSESFSHDSHYNIGVLSLFFFGCLKDNRQNKGEQPDPQKARLPPEAPANDPNFGGHPVDQDCSCSRSSSTTRIVAPRLLIPRPPLLDSRY